MAESGSDPSRLEALRERWERDPASRLFLQLAEEYRRDGQPEAALKVLETDPAPPRLPAARVALGRCRSRPATSRVPPRPGAGDRRRPDAAGRQQALIATYLRLGRLDDAASGRPSLLLNEADPEIAETTAARRLCFRRQRNCELRPTAAEQFVERSAAVRDKPVAAAEPLAAAARRSRSTWAAAAARRRGGGWIRRGSHRSPRSPLPARAEGAFAGLTAAGIFEPRAPPWWFYAGRRAVRSAGVAAIVAAPVDGPSASSGVELPASGHPRGHGVRDEARAYVPRNGPVAARAEPAGAIPPERSRVAGGRAGTRSGLRDGYGRSKRPSPPARGDRRAGTVRAQPWWAAAR